MADKSGMAEWEKMERAIAPFAAKYTATCGKPSVDYDVVDTMHPANWELRFEDGSLHLRIPPWRETAVWGVLRQDPRPLNDFTGRSYRPPLVDPTDLIRVLSTPPRAPGEES